jgi:hypothetical protein
MATVPAFTVELSGFLDHCRFSVIIPTANPTTCNNDLPFCITAVQRVILKGSFYPVEMQLHADRAMGSPEWPFWRRIRNQDRSCTARGECCDRHAA